VRIELNSEGIGMIKKSKFGQVKVKIFRAMIIGASLCTAQSAFPHPVTYKGNTNLMSFNTPTANELWLGYTFHRQVAFTMRGIRTKQSEAFGGEREFLFPQINILAQRWNAKGSQGNLYFFTGYGFEYRRGHAEGPFDGALITGIEADWESRRYYISGKYQLIRLTDKPSLDSDRFRIGMAPYLSEYDELGTWFIVQASRMENRFDKINLTPLLRFYYQNVLWEVGASLRGGWLFNFMVHF